MKDWLSKYVDFKVLINLEERADRYSLAIDEFQKIDITDIYHFPAIKHRIGKSGCTKSHYEIVKIAKESGHKNVLIFEDDVEFAGTKEEIQTTLSNCFDQIKLHNIQPDILYLGANLLKPLSNKKYHQRIDSNLYELGGCKTTHAYIIFESMYDTIIDGYKNIDWDDQRLWNGNNRWTIDYWYLSRIYHHDLGNKDRIRKIIPYGVYPCIAGQRQSFSDLQNRITFLDMPTRWNKILEESND